jgi:lipopolysaccharide transport protein LptA/LPS export ABC transporter protein LptC
MKNRDIVVYSAVGFIIFCLVLASYFFLRKPEKLPTPFLEEGKRVIVFKDVAYSGEKKGVVDWELKARIARKSIDRPEVEMEDLSGSYKPKADLLITFSGSRGKMNTEDEKGAVEDVTITYRKEYQLVTKRIEFDFKAGITSTTAPVEIKGTSLTLRGVGMTANTGNQTVRIERDVTGFIQTDRGKYRFESDRFSYVLKESLYILDGKVVMKGEEMNLLCQKLHIKAREGQIERIDASGKVRLISKGTITKSEKAVYNFREDTVTLTERPSILRDNVEMEGERVVYNLTTGKFSIDKPRMRLEQ